MNAGPTAPRITITKLAAARRQLCEAIRLWFEGGDVVAIHTLACAAHQIIHDINRKQGGRDLVFDSLIFKDEYQKDAVKWLKKDMNFFKHADNDPDGTIEFCPELSELFFMGSLWGIENFGLNLQTTERAFSHWYLLKHPQFLTAKGLSQRNHLSETGALDEIDTMPAHEFFRYYMHASRMQSDGEARQFRK